MNCNTEMDTAKHQTNGGKAHCINCSKRNEQTEEAVAQKVNVKVR